MGACGRSVPCCGLPLAPKMQRRPKPHTPASSNPHPLHLRPCRCSSPLSVSCYAQRAPMTNCVRFGPPAPATHPLHHMQLYQTHHRHLNPEPPAPAQLTSPPLRPPPGLDHQPHCTFTSTHSAHAPTPQALPRLKPQLHCSPAPTAPTWLPNAMVSVASLAPASRPPPYAPV